MIAKIYQIILDCISKDEFLYPRISIMESLALIFYPLDAIIVLFKSHVSDNWQGCITYYYILWKNRIVRCLACKGIRGFNI